MRKIIHIDMDCFYAAVEMRDDPSLRDIPIGVGGNGPRSVLCTCNYEARKYGVRSAMPNSQALKLCPTLKIVNGRMNVYREVSEQIRSIFNRYTNLIEPLSLDEAYLDVTDCSTHSGSATLIARQIRQDIFDETGLTASAGVAPNKFIAKIASDENKPNGQCVITPNDVDAFVQNLPLKKIPGVGPKTAEKLSRSGLDTCADVRQSSIAKLQLIVGKSATSLYQRSHGIDHRALETSRIRKSLAIETTLAEDISGEQACLQTIKDLQPKLEERLERVSDRAIAKQGVKVKFSDFTQTTVEQRSDFMNEQLFQALLQKAISRSNGKSIRLIGLTLGFEEKKAKQAQMALPL